MMLKRPPTNQMTRPPTPDLLAALVTLDLLIETNEELTVQWREYKRMLEGAALEPEAIPRPEP